MTNEGNVPKERALVEVSPETKALVDEQMPNETQQVKNETMALIEAVKRKAQVEAQKVQDEAQKASELTREKYLEAVRSAREEVEKANLFDPERIEYTFKLMQMDAEKNWEKLVHEVSVLGDRLQDAAKAAWEAFTAPHPDYSDNLDESKKL